MKVSRIALAAVAPVVVATSLVVPSGVAWAGVASCDTWTQDGRAFASCNIKSGQYRIRADCVNFPDRYSPWFGAGNWVMFSGKCPWGIRGAILEGR